MNIDKVAKLAHLSLSEQEKVIMNKEMDAIFKWIDALKAFDGEDEMIPTASVMFERSDMPNIPPSTEALLANAPQQAYGMFSVPKVVETV